MTSITHAAATSSSTILPGRRAHAAPAAGRFRFGADSKAVRLGLGVAIAAVLAGDVYAVLRSPVAEGSAAGRGGAASAAASDGGAAGAVDGGYVATNPFGEAAYGADLASRFAVPVAAAGAGSAPAASTAVAAPAPVLTAPAVSAPSLSTPIAPVGSFVPPVVGPAGPTTPEHVGPAPTPAEPGLLAPVVELVPQAGPVATIVEDVVASLPTPVAEAVTAPASVAEVVSVPAALAVPGGLSL